LIGLIAKPVVKETIQRSAEVLELSPDGVNIRVTHRNQCGGCQKQQSCGQQLFAGLGNDSVYVPFSSKNERARLTELHPGREVTVVSPVAELLKLARICYLQPAIFMFLGAWLAEISTEGGDLAAILGSLAGPMVGCFCLWLYDARGAGQTWLSRLEIR
jgi:positive regulator of sigma E activity